MERKKKKVLLLSAANSVHTEKWFHALQEFGYKVVLVSSLEHRAGSNIRYKNSNIRYLPISGRKGYYLNVPYLKKLVQLEAPDIINVHYASGYGTLARLAKLPNPILSVWGSDIFEFPYQNKLKKIVLRKNLEYAKAIASTSRVMASQVNKIMRRDMKCVITPFGVDCTKFKPMEKREGNFFTFGTVKTLTEKYAIDVLIKAFALFSHQLDQNKKANVILKIVGKGDLEQDLKLLCKKLKIENHVFFQGWIPNDFVPNMLNTFDVFCVSSKMESFGVCAVEAMACQIPVIATDAAGFKEVITDQVTGILVRRDHPEEMAEQMMVLYQDAQLRKHMGQEGRKKVLKEYNWDENKHIMIHLYEEIGKI